MCKTAKTTKEVCNEFAYTKLLSNDDFFKVLLSNRLTSQQRFIESSFFEGWEQWVRGYRPLLNKGSWGGRSKVKLL
jgi:hypothetical protein